MKYMKKISMNSRNFKFIKVNGTDLSYRVERRNVKYPRLEFKAGELLAILPKNWKDETSVLEDKMDWIRKKHAEIQGGIDKIKTQGKGANSLLILGDFFEFRGDGPLEIDFDEKWVKYDYSNQNHLKRLTNILKKKLLYEIEQAAGEYNGKFGVKFNRIFVRRQRTRWGSCSSNGNLSFNFWLICLPRELIRYVVCHEVLHLKENRHGKAFWEIVDREFKNYKQFEKNLFEYWSFIQEYFRSSIPSSFVSQLSQNY
jgi:predicted metal-dependent hydrolase